MGPVNRPHTNPDRNINSNNYKMLRTAEVNGKETMTKLD